MRIGLMADVYKPHVSGVTNHIALTKKALEEMGHAVYVFTFGDEDHVDDEPNVIRSQGLPLSIPAADLDFQFGLRYSREAQHLLRTMDVVHVHHPSLSGRLALRYCKPRRIPIVYTNHTRYDLYYHAYLPWMPDMLGEAFFRTFVPMFCRGVDMVIAPSAGLRDVLVSLGVDVDIEVVPNGIDLDPIYNSDDAIAREALGFSEEAIVLVYVGRLGPEKNLPFLLRSFAGAAHAYDNLRLLLVGDGPERDNLEDRVNIMEIGDKVQFTGMVPYDEIPQYLRMADVFVTASVTEVHPLTVIEAMAAGLPVLGVHSPGISDTVEEGVTGFLADEDMAEFTAKMVRIATLGEGLQEMSANARRLAKNYSIDVTARDLLTRYTKAVERTALKPWSARTRLIKITDKIRW